MNISESGSNTSEIIYFVTGLVALGTLAYATIRAFIVTDNRVPRIEIDQQTGRANNPIGQPPSQNPHQER